jgi:hypothetical protein
MQNQKPSQNNATETAFEGCVTFDEFKKSLGPVASKYSDEEIERQRIVADQMADVFFDIWLRKRNSGIVMYKEN